jgi:hypothetical protein
MPFIKYLVSKRNAYCIKLVTMIFLLSEIMPFCSCYVEKGLICVAIAALSSYQPSFYAECTKLNIYSSYNV